MWFSIFTFIASLPFSTALAQEEKFPSLLEKLKDTLVSVRVVLLNEFNLAEGTGFFVDQSGVVIVPRKLVQAIAEQGTDLIIETRDGKIAKNPRLFGCEDTKKTSCFLDTKLSPERWFAFDELLGPATGIKAFALGMNSKREIFLEEFQTKGPKLQLDRDAPENFLGGPVFTIDGDLLGALSDKNLREIDSSQGQLNDIERIKWQAPRFFKQARAAKLKKRALLIHQKTKNAAKKKISLSLSTGQVDIDLPLLLAGEKACRRAKNGDAVGYSCRSQLFRVDISVSSRKDSIRFLEGNISSEPRALDVVERQMKATPSYWQERELNMPKQVREQLASQPGVWSCRVQQAGARRCFSVEQRYRELTNSRVRAFAEVADSDLVLELNVSGDSQLQARLNQVLLESLQTAKWQKAKDNSRAPASVMTSAGRLSRARDFCYVDRRFCRLRIR